MRRNGWFSILFFCLVCLTALAGCISGPGSLLPTLSPSPVPTTLTTATTTTEPVPEPSLSTPATPSPTPTAFIDRIVWEPPVCPAGTYPAITPASPQGIATMTPQYEFAFGSHGTLSLSAPVEMSVYKGAVASGKSAVLQGNLPDGDWIPCYYRAFIDDGHQENLYRALLGEFRRLKLENNLDSDEYLELLTVFVQSIPYSTENVAPKFPVETFMEYSGDCDDKSLLLAGLLAREGYNVSLLYFSAEKHMGVGIEDSDFSFRDTGYAYIETTNLLLVGMAPVSIQGGRELRSDPLVIRVGGGNRGYGSGLETKAIADAYDGAKAALLDSLPSLNGDRDRLNELLESGGIVDYYIVERGRDAGFETFKNNLLTCAYISSHMDDRPAITAWLSAH